MSCRWPRQVDVCCMRMPSAVAKSRKKQIDQGRAERMQEGELTAERIKKLLQLYTPRAQTKNSRLPPTALHTMTSPDHCLYAADRSASESHASLHDALSGRLRTHLFAC